MTHQATTAAITTWHPDSRRLLCGMLSWAKDVPRDSERMSRVTIRGAAPMPSSATGQQGGYSIRG